MEKRSVLGLVHDMGAGNVVGRILQELGNRGHTVILLAEERGRAKNRLTMPFQTIDNDETLNDYFILSAPDVVITGLSGPRYLETALDRLARKSGVPVVQVEDYWSVFGHAPDVPDLYITIDALAERLIRNVHPDVPIVIAGLAGILPGVPRPDVVSLLTEVRERTGAKILVYPDGGPDSSSTLPRLVESLLRTRMSIMLVPKFHPRYKNVTHPNGGTWDKWCQEQLDPLRRYGKIVEIPAATDEVIEAADGVASSYSTTLMRPARVGKLALTLWDDIVHTNFKANTGLDETPLMMDGRFPVLRDPQPLDSFFMQLPTYDLKPFNASIAADAVLKLVPS